MLSILVPKKHLGKNFPQICSLEKLKTPLLFQAIKPNTGCKIQNSCTQDKKTALSYISFFLLVLIHCENLYCKNSFFLFQSELTLTRKMLCMYVKMLVMYKLFCARETPGEKFPTDLQLGKA